MLSKLKGQLEEMRSKVQFLGLVKKYTYRQGPRSPPSRGLALTGLLPLKPWKSVPVKTYTPLPRGHPAPRVRGGVTWQQVNPTVLTRAPGHVRGAVGPGALRPARDREHRGRPLRHTGLQPPGRVFFPHLLQRQQAPAWRPAEEGPRPAGWHAAGAHGLPLFQVQRGGRASLCPPGLRRQKQGENK